VDEATFPPGGAAMYPASRLLRQILTLNHELEKQLGRRLGVNLTDLTAMEHLISSGPLSPTAIADRLGVSTAATTGAIDRLVKAGHVSRQPHSSDRRRLLIVPRPESVRRAMASLMPMILETNALLDDYTDEERATITGYLSRTVEVLTRTLEGGDAESAQPTSGD
jgi:DNA-binding MarR family transcriptional regulator